MSEEIISALPALLEDDNAEPMAPKNSIPNAIAARVVYESIKRSNTKRIYNYARIQGMLDGNPPYSRATVTQGGMQVMSNINMRDGESLSDSVKLAYWSLFNDVMTIAEFTTDIGEAAQNSFYGKVVSDEFDRTLRSWDEFYLLMNQHQADVVDFGTSFLFWPHERGWKFETCDIYSAMVPERTRNHPKYISIFVLEDVKSAEFLWDAYRQAKDDDTDEEDYEEGEAPQGNGWNKEALGRFLLELANITDKEQYSSSYMAEIQQKIRNGDLGYDQMYNEDILLTTMLVKELDGKVSRGILNTVGTKDEYGKWLYFQDRQYESMQKAIALFTFTPGQKFVHGNKGFGHRIFNVTEGISQVDNSTIDGVRRSQTVLVRSKTTRGKNLKKINFTHGGMVDIGEAEFVQNLMGANLGSGVDVAQYLRNKVETNNNVSGASMRTPDGKVPTLGQQKISVTKEARVQKNRTSHYYEGLDILLREVYRKMMTAREGDPGYDEVQKLKERCIARGVPAEFFAIDDDNVDESGLPDHLQISATRAGGSGSQVADQVETEGMMQMLPILGERGRANVIEDRISALRGHRYVNRYYPPEDRDRQPTADDTIASIENNQLEKGEMVVVSPDNNHAIHAARHLNRLKQIAEVFQQAEGQAREAGSKTASVDAGQFGQYGLNEVDIAFQTIGPHFVRHMFFLQQDPSRASMAQGLAAQWAILANYGDKIANNAQEHRVNELRKQQAAQAEIDAIPSEERVAMAKIESDERIKTRKLLLEVQAGANRDQLQYLLQRIKVSKEAELKKQVAMAELAADAAKSTSEENTGKANGALY